MAGWLAVGLAGWLAAGLAGWLGGWVAGAWLLAGWTAGWLAGCWLGWLAGRRAGWLAGWLADWLAGWMAGLPGWIPYDFKSFGSSFLSLHKSGTAAASQPAAEPVAIWPIPKNMRT